MLKLERWIQEAPVSALVSVRSRFLLRELPVPRRESALFRQKLRGL